jgi:hypothetical protein
VTSIADSGSLRLTSGAGQCRRIRLPNCPNRNRTYGIQLHASCLWWSGRQDLNLRLPSPEACGLPYLYEYKANIFV